MRPVYFNVIACKLICKQIKSLLVLVFMKKAIFALEREKKILKGPTKFCVKAFCSPVYPIKTIVKGC